MTRAAGSRPVLAKVVDAFVLTVLVVLALAPLHAVYGAGSFWVAAVGGAVLGAAVAAVGAWRRWGALAIAAVATGAYFAFGGALVLREDSIGGVVPTADALQQLAVGVVRVWMQVLTLAVPLVGFDESGVLPYFTALVAAALAVSLGMRARHHGLALVPVAVTLVLAVAFSTYRGPGAVAVGTAGTALALGWASWRSHAARLSGTTQVEAGEGPRRWPTVRRRATAAVTLAAVTLAGAAALTAAGTDPDRRVLRDHVLPPLELHDYASPLSSFRKYVTDGEDSVLFTVTGLPAGTPVRLATLDLYDGIVYQVTSGGSGSFARVGRSLPAGDDTGEPAHVEIEVRDLRGVWLPTVGRLTAVAFSGDTAPARAETLHYNATSGAAVVTSGVLAGDEYAFDALISADVPDAQLAGARVAATTTPTPLTVPSEVSGLLEKAVAGADSPLTQLRSIETFLATEGFFSNGLEGEVTSRSGHAAERIATLLGASQMIGDDEQYAVAMALMVSQLGMPVRVVMGFVPEATGEKVEVTGADVHAWVEVPFENYGWVRFDPTPPEDQVPQEQTPEQAQRPQAQVAQPPDPPEEPVELPPPPVVEEASNVAQEDTELTGRNWPMIVAAGSLGLLGVGSLPSIVLAFRRSRRRHRRRHRGGPADRIDGGWAEVVDAAVDVGIQVRPGATRREHAAVLVAERDARDLLPLAGRADVAVFGAGDPSEEDVAAYWADVETAVAGLRRRSPWPARLRAKLLPASVRRGPRTKRAVRHGR